MAPNLIVDEMLKIEGTMAGSTGHSATDKRGFATSGTRAANPHAKPLSEIANSIRDCLIRREGFEGFSLQLTQQLLQFHRHGAVQNG